MRRDDWELKRKEIQFPKRLPQTHKLMPHLPIMATPNYSPKKLATIYLMFQFLAFPNMDNHHVFVRGKKDISTPPFSPHGNTHAFPLGLHTSTRLPRHLCNDEAFGGVWFLGPSLKVSLESLVLLTLSFWK